MKFIIKVKEVWVQAYRVEAKTKEEAIKKMTDLSSDIEILDGSMELSHWLNPEHWIIDPEK